MSFTFKEVAKSIADKLWSGSLVVAKFLADRLSTAVLTALLTLFGLFLIEKFKVSENLNLEKYKENSSTRLYDSNKFVEKADLVWTKANKFSADVGQLSGLYWIRNSNSRPPLNLKSSIPALDKEREKRMSDLDIEIEWQRSIVTGAKKEFYDILFANQFYLGEEISFQIALYVETTHDLVRGEEMLDDSEKYAKQVDENLADFKRETDRLTDRLWEVVLNMALENVPNMRDPDTEAHLPQDLQMIWHRQQREDRERNEEDLKKLREESISNMRKRWAENRKSTEEQLRKLRFGYAAARRYSLERQP